MFVFEKRLNQFVDLFKVKLDSLLDITSDTMIFISVLLVFSLVLGGYAETGTSYLPCCPSCSSREVDPLVQEQKYAINNSRALIQTFEGQEFRLLNITNQVPIVNLTVKQKLQILRNYPDLFLSSEAYQNRENPTTRFQRSRSKIPTCSSLPMDQPVQLAFTPSGAESRLVQIVQMPEKDRQQWHYQLSGCDIVMGVPQGTDCYLKGLEYQVVYIDLTDAEIRLGYVELPVYCEANFEST